MAVYVIRQKVASGVVCHNGLVQGTSLRERKRLDTVARIERAAMRLFLRRGYDSVTVAEIAQAADVAPRTFFRYFQAKEEVLFGRDAEVFQLVAQTILERPADEDLLSTTRAVCDAMVEWVLAHEDLVRDRQNVVQSSPGLAGREAAKRALLDRAAAALIRERMRAQRSDPRPLLYARVASACYDAAVEAWSLEGTPLRRALDNAFAALPL